MSIREQLTWSRLHGRIDQLPLLPAVGLLVRGALTRSKETQRAMGLEPVDARAAA